VSRHCTRVPSPIAKGPRRVGAVNPFIAVLITLGAMLASPGFAQNGDQSAARAAPLPSSIAPAGSEAEGVKLAKQLANPIASLISFPLQSNYDWGLGPDGSGGQYKLNVQPVVPMTLSGDWNLISRTIVPLVAQHEAVPIPPAADNSQSGLGDIVQSLFLSPKKPSKSGIIWGAGPVFLVPTASGRLLGSGKWGAGPTAVALKQSGPWTVGALANQIWSIAGKGDREKVSATFLQPFAAYTTKAATTYSVNTESTYDWVRKQWTVPVNLMIAQLLRPTATGIAFPIQVQIGFRHSFAQAKGGAKNGVRLSFVALFPRK
jgi:hypothetical protein